MKKILLLLAISLPFAQRMDPIDLAIDELRTIVETASRSSQKVFVEDLPGSTDHTVRPRVSRFQKC